MIQTTPQQERVQRITTRKLTYPYSEKIRYNRPPPASPDARMAKSSELIALICKAALRSKFSRRSRLDFDADALTSCTVLGRPSGSGTNHRGICMTVTAGDLLPAPGLGYWRTPLVIIVAGFVIGLLCFGPR